MPIRLRKLIGAVALIALVVSWALLAMAIASGSPVPYDLAECDLQMFL